MLFEQLPQFEIVFDENDEMGLVRTYRERLKCIDDEVVDFLRVPLIENDENDDDEDDEIILYSDSTQATIDEVEVELDYIVVQAVAVLDADANE
jgi:hypothetical protein